MRRANPTPQGGTMVERRDVEFTVDGGDRLRGWLFLPSKRTGRLPAISLAHGYAGVKELDSSASHALSPRPVSSRSSMTIEISVRAMGPFDTTSIPGARSPIGDGRSLFWNRGPKSMQQGSEFGAPVTPAAMSWCSAQPTAGSGLPPSACTSKDCAAYRPMPSRPLSINSTRTSEPNFEASHFSADAVIF